ncbi:MAG: ABC transporter permease subunit [Pirellulaceae bacterium]|nr:ABC transporter permease subunit [Pirellulaceae bacterium]
MRNRITGIILFGVVSLGITTVWYFCSSILGENRFPSPVNTLEYTFRSLYSSPIINREGGGSLGFLPHIAATLRSFTVAILVGMPAGICLAALIHGGGFYGEIAKRVLEFFRALPPLIFIPFFMLLIGPGVSSVIMTASTYAALMCCSYAISGLEQLDQQFVESATLFGASRWKIWWSVRLPAMLPMVFGGIRISGALTLGIIIVAEYLGASYGLGRTMRYAVSYSSAILLFSSVVWSVGVGLLFEVLLALGLRFNAKWRYVS